jgi:hypothetical protein
MAADSTYAIELKDETSGAAESAANALSKLKKRIDDDTKALSQMQAAMRRLKGATTQDSAAVKALSDQISAQKAKIAGAQSAYVKLGGTFDGKVTPAITDATGGLKGFLGFMKTLPPHVLAAAAAVAAFVGGIVAATAALLAYGIAQANARRNEELQLERLAVITRRFGGAAGSGRELQESIDRVSSRVAAGRSEVSAYAQQLYRAGLRGAALGTALERGLIRRMGGVDLARRRFLSLDVQASKLQESFSALFAGLEIEGFLGALNEVTQLFSQNTATGRALKAIVEALLQPLIDGITFLAPLARRFFQGMVIGALLLTIGIQRLSRWLTEALGGTELLSNTQALEVALWAGVAVFGALALAVVAAGVALAAVTISLAALAAPILAAVAAVGALIYGGYRLVQWWRAQDWSAIGRSLVDGLVNGIRSGAARVTQAVRGLAGEARRALAQALGIFSPSRVFAQLGVQIPRGLAQGVQRATPIAVDAVDTMAVASSGSSPAASSGVVASIGEVHVHVGPQADGREIARSIRDELVEVLEGLVVARGAPA